MVFYTHERVAKSYILFLENMPFTKAFGLYSTHTLGYLGNQALDILKCMI